MVISFGLVEHEQKRKVFPFREKLLYVRKYISSLYTVHVHCPVGYSVLKVRGSNVKMYHKMRYTYWNFFFFLKRVKWWYYPSTFLIKNNLTLKSFYNSMVSLKKNSLKTF